jgi:hypothetical protein
MMNRGDSTVTYGQVADEKMVIGHGLRLMGHDGFNFSQGRRAPKGLILEHVTIFFNLHFDRRLWCLVRPFNFQQEISPGWRKCHRPAFGKFGLRTISCEYLFSKIGHLEGLRRMSKSERNRQNFGNRRVHLRNGLTINMGTGQPVHRYSHQDYAQTNQRNPDPRTSTHRSISNCPRWWCRYTSPYRYKSWHLCRPGHRHTVRPPP